MCRVTPSSIKIDGTHLNVWTKGGTGNISRDTVGLKKKMKTMCRHRPFDAASGTPTNKIQYIFYQ